VDRRTDLERHFEAGTHLLVFDDADELKRLVRAALQDFAASEALGVAARKQVLAGHTYMHRMREILAKVTGEQ
jgi:spore maturation protein CgeB